MDMFTMNENFIAQDVVDEFFSAIWTERYSANGDVQLLVPATDVLVDRLAEGTFLGLRGSKEVMELQTQSVEKGILTVVGTTLVKFLDNRLAWFHNPDTADAGSRVVDRVVVGKPGQVIADAVEDMVITTADFPSGWGAADIEWADEEIEGLILGAVDTSGVDERINVNIGSLYSGIAQIAEKYGVGISLYLDSANIETGFVLKFKTYRGVDRTSDGAEELVRLQPALDSLSDIKELRSIADYKNVCYVYYQGIVTVHYEDPMDIPAGWDRRVLVTDAVGEPVGRKYTGSYGGGTWTNYVVGAPEIAAFRAQNAKDALANHNYIRAIDGQTSPENDYKFGEDYFLGDLIELQGLTGNIAKARVTEYIRSQDKSGEREYPTISVV